MNDKHQIDRNNPLPLFLQLKRLVRSEILEGKKKPGERIPFEKDLAKIYGFSRMTVHHALTELAKEGLVVRIKSKGTFVTDSVKMETDLAETQRRFAFIVPDIDDLFIHEIYRGIEKTASKNGYKAAVFSSMQSIDKEKENIQSLLIKKNRSEEGAIIFPTWGRANAEQIFELKKEGIPFVLVDRFFRDIETDRVIVDNVEGGYSAVMHLIKHGHRRIGYIGGVDCTADEDRLKGYLKALSDKCVVYDSQLVRKISSVDIKKSIRFEPDYEGGYKEMGKFLEMDNKPTAVFSANDYIAWGTLRAIRDAGLKVPDDIALVGFDDLKFTTNLEVSLTTVAQPKQEIGRLAATILIQKIEAKRKEIKKAIRQVTLSTKLVIRQSCGCKTKKKDKKTKNEEDRLNDKKTRNEGSVPRT